MLGIHGRVLIVGATGVSEEAAGTALCWSSPPMMWPTTCQNFNRSEEHMAPLLKLTEEKGQQLLGAGGTAGHTNGYMADAM